MASEKILNQKIKEVEELAEKIGKAKIVLLTDYKGINVADVTAVRTKVRAAQAEYKVIKNNNEETTCNRSFHTSATCYTQGKRDGTLCGCGGFDLCRL